jgi:hypothetical protein
MAQTTEPTIICPKCHAEIKLTESLAAPLIESTRREFKTQLAAKDAEVAARETALREGEDALAKAQESIDVQVADKVRGERAKIVAEEAKKAKIALDADLQQKAQEIVGLQEIVKERDAKLVEAQKAQAELARERRELEDAKQELELSVEERLREGREKIAADAEKRVKLALEGDLQERAKELADLQEVLKERDAKLAEAQNAQAELIRKQRELDDAKRELELTVEKRVQEGLDATHERARKEAEEALGLKLSESQQTITSMQKQIEELKRKAEQGSQQLQGEVLELELEARLTSKFPIDNIVPVPKGEFGGDVLQCVVSPLGQVCGTILWESKRTKNWSDGWLSKLRDDQRTAKAEVAVLVSQALPKGVDSFDCVNGVWVAHPRAAIPVAMYLRQMLIEVSLARQSSEGQKTKAEVVYQYLIGPRFRLRVEAIVEAFSSMQDDLAKEKKAIMKQWAKRETQIERVMEATVGMYGDLQGIAGKSLQEVEGLSLPALEDHSTA